MGWLISQWTQREDEEDDDFEQGDYEDVLAPEFRPSIFSAEVEIRTMTRPAGKPVSQALFERFCQKVEIKASPIPEDSKGGPRTPDYLLAVESSEIVVEVKQLDPSDEEKKLIEELERKGIANRKSTPGKRVSQEIADSMQRDTGRVPRGSPRSPRVNEPCTRETRTRR